ncbi:AAA family ATPase [Thermocoleostomius sinensis]|uniref:AAA family ATPase n=1 Tax=Thermocoleostomius sinensis A174 TaxID=2016057 RepID=A0A9E9C9K0_9CYAN|nr:AAA family ATPase [Thermocoleostomius sinensis]WAL61683.1 AAA family ATPase [Thermocoleostomius sinensis A174]
MRKRLYLLIGLPGSGKSTLAASMQGTCSTLRLVSTDRIRGQLFGDEAIQGPWSLIWRQVGQQLREIVQQIEQGQCQAVLYDATNTRRQSRRAVIALARSLAFTHITGLWIDTPLSVCLERNRQRDRQVPDEVIQRMQRQLEGAPPNLEEGLSCLIRYSSCVDQARSSRTSPPILAPMQMSLQKSQPLNRTSRGTEIPLFSMTQPNPLDLNSW